MTPLFAARGKLCASAYLWPRRSRFCAARRGRPIHCRAQHRPRRPRDGPQGRPPGGSRSIPMAVGFPTCIPACTACTRYRRGCARCAASPPPRSRRQDLGLSWCGRHVRRVQHHHHVEREAMSLGQASGAGEPRPFLGGGEDKKTRKGIRGENAWLRSKISAQSDVCDPILAPFSVRRRCRW